MVLSIRLEFDVSAIALDHDSGDPALPPQGRVQVRDQHLGTISTLIRTVVRKASPSEMDSAKSNASVMAPLIKGMLRIPKKLAVSQVLQLVAQTCQQADESRSGHVRELRDIKKILQQN